MSEQGDLMSCLSSSDSDLDKNDLAVEFDLYILIGCFVVGSRSEDSSRLVSSFNE